MKLEFIGAAMKQLLCALAFIVVSCVGAPAFAAQSIFNFGHLQSTTVGFLPDGNLGTDYVACTGSDLCSKPGDGLFYLSNDANDISVFVTGFYNSVQWTVVQDHDSGYSGSPLYGPTAKGAGLGVYHTASPPTSDDNVTAGEMLKLSFEQMVTIGTLGLRAEGHNTTGWIPDAKFQYSINGTTWTTASLPIGTGAFALNQTSQDFWFRYGPTSEEGADQFYISSISVTPVPEPEIYAMFAAGLGLMGFVARRRKMLDAAVV